MNLKKDENKYVLTVQDGFNHSQKSVYTVTTKVASPKASAKEAAKNPVKAASDGVKGLFNKGKDFFKKKDKK